MFEELVQKVSFSWGCCLLGGSLYIEELLLGLSMCLDEGLEELGLKDITLPVEAGLEKVLFPHREV